MARIKIKVNAAVLQKRTKSLNITIGSGTTALNVITKVIDKCGSQEPSRKLQLWAVISSEVGIQTGITIQNTNK